MKSSWRRNFKVGQTVVYRMPKSSTSPGQRAINVRPSTAGESYNYEVEKYWVVSKVFGDQRVELVTRTGKRHVISVDDKRLRLASWIERTFSADRFPNLDLLGEGSLDSLV